MLKKNIRWIVLGFVLLIIPLWFWYDRNLYTTFNEEFDFEIDERRVIVTNIREQFILEKEEVHELNTILNNLEMKEKVIPNVKAFDSDAFILFTLKDGTATYTIDFDMKRNIIGIKNQNNYYMDQYILKKDSPLLSFVQGYFK